MTPRIVYVVTEKLPVPPVKGGAMENWVYEIARRVRTGSRFVLSVHDPELERSKGEAGVGWRTYKPGFAARGLLGLKRSPFRNLASPLYFLPFSLWAAWEARRIGADIIHLHTRLQFVPVLRILNPRAKLIVHLHNTASLEPENRPWPERYVRGADVFVACSEFLKNEIVKLYPSLSNRTFVLYNGVNLPEFAPDSAKRSAARRELGIADDEIAVFYSGRLVTAKGAHVLVNAFHDNAAAYPKTKLLVLGGVMYSDNRQTPYIRQLKESRSDLGGRIKFLGYVDHARIPYYLNAADIVVVPSLCDEAFGVAIIEGMAAGKCVVAFNKGGIREVMHNGENGVLLDDARTEPLRRALVGLYDAPFERRDLGQKALGWVGLHFSWERVVRDVEEFYAGLVSGSGKKPV